jgi:hypothetical protein
LPVVFAAGVPANVPPVNVTPLGRVPVSVTVGAGDPVAVTAKLPATPTVNVALLALENPGDMLGLLAPQPAVTRLATKAKIIRVRETGICTKRAELDITAILYSGASKSQKLKDGRS